MLHPKGEKIKQNLLNLWRKLHEEEGFQFLRVPQSNSLFELTQAHLDFTLARPSVTFPFKIAEMNYFKEEGAKPMEGLLASQEYSADAAHIFCTEETLLQMCISSLQFMRKFSKLFPFEIKWILAPSQKRKKQFIILTEALKVLGIEYSIDERKKPHHGPEVSLIVRDGIGRQWCGPSLRLECLLLEKVGFQGALIVRSLFSSVERWIALLLEQTQGWLPFWLAPEQVRVVCVDSEQMAVATDVTQKLQSVGLSVNLCCGGEQEQLQESLHQHILYAIVIGKKQQDSNELQVSDLKAGKEERMDLRSFLQKMSELKKDE
jgi:threonyl-tRNA synthetase